MRGDILIVKQKRPKGENGYKVFSIRVPEDTVARMDEVSQKTGRSRNELIGIFLNYALSHCVIEEREEHEEHGTPL